MRGGNRAVGRRSAIPLLPASSRKGRRSDSCSASKRIPPVSSRRPRLQSCARSCLMSILITPTPRKVNPLIGGYGLDLAALPMVELPHAPYNRIIAAGCRCRPCHGRRALCVRQPLCRSGLALLACCRSSASETDAPGNRDWRNRNGDRPRPDAATKRWGALVQVMRCWAEGRGRRRCESETYVVSGPC